MRRRLLESLGVAAVIAALVLFLQLSAAGQAPVAKAAPGTAAGAQKTAWGHADIQGIWLQGPESIAIGVDTGQGQGFSVWSI